MSAKRPVEEVPLPREPRPVHRRAAGRALSVGAFLAGTGAFLLGGGLQVELLVHAGLAEGVGAHRDLARAATARNLWIFAALAFAASIGAALAAKPTRLRQVWWILLAGLLLILEGVIAWKL